MAKRILIIISVLVITIAYAYYQKRVLESNLDLTVSDTESILKTLPQANFKSLEGKELSTSSFKTDLLVIHFWGTWCAPCEAELPELLGFIKEFNPNSNVKFLLVAVSDEVVKVKKQIKSLANSEQVRIEWLIDNDNVHRDIFGTTKVPETYVFSSDNALLRKFSGPQEWNKSMFFQIFDNFLLNSTRKL